VERTQALGSRVLMAFSAAQVGPFGTRLRVTRLMGRGQLIEGLLRARDQASLVVSPAPRRYPKPPGRLWQRITAPDQSEKLRSLVGRSEARLSSSSVDSTSPSGCREACSGAASSRCPSRSRSEPLRRRNPRREERSRSCVGGRAGSIVRRRITCGCTWPGVVRPGFRRQGSSQPRERWTALVQPR
jgi:hypothetical protein